MKASPKALFMAVTIGIILILSACNLPIRSPTPFVFPTVNLTETFVNPTLPPPITATPPGAATATTANNQPTSTTMVQPPTSTTAPLPQATATSAPPTSVPPSPTAPLARISPLAVAPFLSTAPKVDGTWTDLPASSEKPANIQVYKNPAYKGDDKPGMSYRIAWDNNYLYIGAKVGDATYFQQSHGDQLYLGDSLEFLIDTDVSGDYTSHSVSSDDYQLGISPGYGRIGENAEAYLWVPAANAGTRTDVKIAAVNPAPGLYRIEVAIPWSMLKITPTAGMHLGFVISFSDDASDSKPEQDIMISNDANRDYTDPTTWGDLTLTK